MLARFAVFGVVLSFAACGGGFSGSDDPARGGSGAGGPTSGGSSGTSSADGSAARGASGGTSGSSTTGGASGTTSSGGSSASSSGGTAGDDAGDAHAPEPCATSTECPASPSPCQAAACIQQICAFVPLAPGIPPVQTPGDCLRLDCNPDGSEQTFADPTDVDDGKPCTDDLCNSTTPVHTPRTGSTCAQGYCDSVGGCVQCLDASHCAGAPECKRAACVSGQCTIEMSPAGTLCANATNQCDGNGACVDCVNNGGCDECCACVNFECKNT